MYLSVYPDKKKPGRTTVYRVFFGGKRGIRTLGGFQAHTRFPVVRLRPAQPSFHMEVLTRFELVNKGFADLRLTTWPQHRKWSGLRGSNSLPPPWQGGALPDELKPQIYCSVIISYTALNCKCFFGFFYFSFVFTICMPVHPAKTAHITPKKILPNLLRMPSPTSNPSRSLFLDGSAQPMTCPHCAQKTK